MTYCGPTNIYFKYLYVATFNPIALIYIRFISSRAQPAKPLSYLGTRFV